MVNQVSLYKMVNKVRLFQMVNQMRQFQTLLTGEPTASFHSLKTALFTLGLSHWKHF